MLLHGLVCFTHAVQTLCQSHKNSTEIFITHQCSDLTGTAINEMETCTKREGTHLLSPFSLTNPSCIKAHFFFFTPPINLYLSRQGRCCLAHGAARLQQIPACASCCPKTCSNPISLLLLPLISHYCYHFVCCVDFMNTSSGISVCVCVCAEDLSSMSLMKCAIHSDHVDRVLWVGRIGSRWRAWTDFGWRPLPLLHEWHQRK